MKQYSFLNESFNKVLKRSSGLSKNASERYLDNWIHSRMLKDTINNSKNEYAKMMFVGTKNKLQNAANKSNRKILVIGSHSADASATSIGGNYSAMKLRPTGSKLARSIRHGDDIVSLSVPEKQLTDSILKSFLINNHEADEYNTVLKLAKKHNLTPAQIMILINKRYKFGHAPGVISKENKTNEIIKKLFKIDALKGKPRLNDEVLNDKIKFNPEEIKKTLTPQELVSFNNNGIYKNPRDLARLILQMKKNGIKG